MGWGKWRNYIDNIIHGSMTDAMLGNMPTVDAGQFQWVIWCAGCIITALCSGIIWLYKDNKADRKAYSTKLETIIEKNTIALNGLIKAVEELRQDLREDRMSRKS